MKRLAPVLGLAALALWIWALRLPGLSLPMTKDEGGIAYQASILEEGGVPYRDSYEPKPPMPFFLYRLAFRLLGGEGERGPRLLVLVFSSATLLFLFALAPSEWPPAARLAAPAAYAALGAEPIGSLGFAAVPEAFLGLFTSASAWLLVRSWQRPERGRWLFFSGLATGLAVMTKQAAAWPGAAFLALALWERRTRDSGPARRLQEGAAFCLGTATAAAPFLIFFAGRGALSDLWEQAFRGNLDSSAAMLAPGATALQLDWFRKVVLPQFLAGDWPVCLLAGAGLLSPREAHDRREALFAVWLAATAAGTAAAGLYFQPQCMLPVHPPLALAAAMGVRRLAAASANLGWAAAAALALFPAAVHARAYLLEPPELAAKRLLHPNPLYEARHAADFIRERSRPSDKIYVFGSEPQVYVRARRRAATRRLYTPAFSLSSEDGAAAVRDLVELEAAPPRFLVYAATRSDPLPAAPSESRFRDGVRKLASTRYRWIAEVPVLAGGGSSGALVSEPGPGAAPDFQREDRLYIFELN